MGKEELWGHMGMDVNPGSPPVSRETWVGDSASMSHGRPLYEMDWLLGEWKVSVQASGLSLQPSKLILTVNISHVHHEVQPTLFPHLFR